MGWVTVISSSGKGVLAGRRLEEVERDVGGSHMAYAVAPAALARRDLAVEDDVPP